MLKSDIHELIANCESSDFERGKETAEFGKVLKALDTIGIEISIQ